MASLRVLHSYTCSYTCYFSSARMSHNVASSRLVHVQPQLSSASHAPATIYFSCSFVIDRIRDLRTARSCNPSGVQRSRMRSRERSGRRPGNVRTYSSTRVLLLAYAWHAHCTVCVARRDSRLESVPAVAV